MKKIILYIHLIAIILMYQSCKNNKTDTNLSEIDRYYQTINDNMTGEELRLAFLDDTISPYDIFMLSDLEYTKNQLIELKELYQKEQLEDYNTLDYIKLTKEYGYPAYSKIPKNAEINIELTLDNCDVITNYGRAEYSIILKYDIGNYYMYIGMDMWSIYIDNISELSTIQWHPVVVYFIPKSDDIMLPKLNTHDIKIYYEKVKNKPFVNSSDIYSWVIFYNPTTDRSIYVHQFPSTHEYSFLHNGSDKILMECDSLGFAIIDLNGNLYDNSLYVYETPWLMYLQNDTERYIPGSAKWIDLDTIVAKNDVSEFYFRLK